MANAEEVYELLAKHAATTAEPITYDELAAITGVPGRFQGAMLGKVSRTCAAAGEPDLSALVVRADTGEVSDGHPSLDPAAERQRCHEFHSRR